MPDATADRLLYLLKSTGPQTAAVLAMKLGITAAAVRQHLDRLATAGLVAASDERQGVGRPKRRWQLGEAGEARFPDSHASLTLELLDSIRSVFGSMGLERLLEDRETAALARYRVALKRGRGLRARLAALVELRSAEGYMAAWSEEPDGGFLMVENHCPICAAARACQGLCRSEQAMFAELLGAEASVVRTEHIIAGARRCAYRITPKR